jgi:hypothetical protein
VTQLDALCCAVLCSMRVTHSDNGITNAIEIYRPAAAQVCNSLLQPHIDRLPARSWPGL